MAPTKSRSFKVIDLNVSLNESCKRPRVVDWSQCAICQEKTEAELKDPSKNTRDKNEGYKMLANNLEAFERLEKLPPYVDLNALRDSTSLYMSFLENHAVWHKSCYLNFSQSKLQRLQKRQNKENFPSTPLLPTTRSSLADSSASRESEKCLFCCKESSRSHPLSIVEFPETWKSVKDQAALSGDTRLLMALDGGNGLQDVLYHKKCRTGFLNKLRVRNESGDQGQAHGMVLAKLYGHMTEVKASSERPPVFKMAELTRLYRTEVEEMGVKGDAHSTRLRERLIQECPTLEALGTKGQDVLIGFKKDIDTSVREDLRDYDGEAFYFAKTAKIVREDVFTKDESGCNSGRNVPFSLKTIVQMLLDGPSLSSSDPDKDTDEVVTSIAELLAFHMRVNRRRAASGVRRHGRDHETATPVYVATKLYGATRQKELVDTFYKLGLSISYDRLQSILDEKAQEVADFYMHEGVVCPKDVRYGVFLTGAADNIDHNPSSTTAKSSFHGTAMSLMQHFTRTSQGEERNTVVPKIPRTRKYELPDDYAVVTATFLNQKSGKCPTSQPVPPNDSGEFNAMDGQREWLDSSRTSDCKTWSEHHSEKDEQWDGCITKVSLLPLHHESAHTMDMMRHCMVSVQRAILHANPDQTPVMVVDNGLYPYCKSVQWQENRLAEGKFFVLLGGMHIEMWAMRVIGQWLDGSGWIPALIEAGVTTPGWAEATIKVSHLCRTRYALEVSAAVLYDMQIAAFEALDDDDPLPFDRWIEKRRGTSPQFQYWDISLNLIMTVLQLIRSERSASFELYISTLEQLAPWFFALNHVNYARWLPVHIRDLKNLKTSNPSLYEKLTQHFVGRETGRRGSRIALDQMHEHKNRELKDDGGMIGLTENPLSLRKFMLATPELSKMNEDFEQRLASKVQEKTNHHLATKCAREAFVKDKDALKATLEELGNPFLDNGDELYNIDTKKVCLPAVVETVKKIEELGKSQYNTFVQERLESSNVDLYQPIKQNKLALFSNQQRSGMVTKAAAKLKIAKTNCKTFADLYTMSSKRPADQNLFFKHESQEKPPALSVDDGTARTTTKSALYHILVEKTVGAAAMLTPGPAIRLFSDYVQDVYLRFLKRESYGVSRVDIVWDRYFDDSLKGSTRAKRGDGDRTKVGLNTKIPRKITWQKFLRNSENKIELFELLSKSIPGVQFKGTVLCSTMDDGVLSSPPHTLNVYGLFFCT